MKKFHLKSYIAGVLTVILVISMITTVFAAARSVTATVNYRDIKVNIDGVPTTLTDLEGKAIEPILLFDTVYVPLSPVARAFGKTSTYDGKSFTVFINTPNTPSPNAPKVESGHSRTNPAPIGTAQIFSNNDYTVTVKVKSVTSGESAWNLIYAENKFNDPPPDGKMYIMANIEVTANKINSDKAVTVDYFDFKAFSGTNAEYDRKSTVIPDKLSGKIFEGGTTIGNAVFLVDKSDTAPKIVYGMKYDGSGGIWFSLK